MSKDEDMKERKEQALRVLAIRKAGEWEGQAFVDKLNSAARELGLRPIYDVVKVSKMENAVRKVSLSDGLALAHIDPDKRTALWIARGGEGRSHPGRGRQVLDTPETHARKKPRKDKDA